MNRQWFFDTSAKYLLAQNEKAIDGNYSCRYRTDDGKKCALGAVLPDELYCPAYEGEAPGLTPGVSAFKNRALAGALGLETENDVSFARALQRVHDENAPSVWLTRLHEFTNTYGLNAEALPPLPA